MSSRPIRSIPSCPWAQFAHLGQADPLLEEEPSTGFGPVPLKQAQLKRPTFPPSSFSPSPSSSSASRLLLPSRNPRQPIRSGSRLLLAHETRDFSRDPTSAMYVSFSLGRFVCASVTDPCSCTKYVRFSSIFIHSWSEVEKFAFPSGRSVPASGFVAPERLLIRSNPHGLLLQGTL
jgi:hypothetical protein